ncbi:Hypothetical predicted protein [Mytilus galloprovincialis]|uniref:Mab-21-like HhH/H2TH-like domain-containing protein n=1 Tax=Mytilus galloprovincialis TaxID=29158 RepID=A0A8B6C5P5_MYTGA|nr:Hypothetical predicted protein [Mytilus galloprovincialis]
MDAVYNTQSEIPSGLPYGLYLDFQNTIPGYVNIQLQVNNSNMIQHKHACSKNSKLLTNVHYEQLIQKVLIPDWRSDILGPFWMSHDSCPSTICGSYHFLSSYRCHSWPIIAAKWITRCRKYQWPSTELIEDIVRENVLLAPIGSKFDDEKDNSYEWKISFEIAEEMLVYSFNHTQLLCYALLKYTLKDEIHKKIQGLMCSYFMKTVLFWMIEESQISEWQPHGLVECFSKCIKRLLYFVQHNVLPNYFIPHNNLIEGMTDYQKKLLLSVLLNVFTNENNSLRQIQSLSSFFCHCEAPFELSRTKHSNLDSIIYPLLHYMHGIGYGGNNTIFQPIYCILSHGECKFSKQIFFIWFSKLCATLGRHYSWIIRKDINKRKLKKYKHNKMFYLNYKKCLWYTVLGTFSDSYTGWLLLAEFFFQGKQFEKTLKVIQLCPLKSSTDDQIITPDIKPHPKSKILEKNGLSFVQRYKLSCSDLFYLTPEAKPHLTIYQGDIQIPHLKEEMVMIYPQIQMLYRLIQCHYYLGNNSEKWKALRLLNAYTLQCTRSHEYMNSSTYLADAMDFVETMPGFLLTDFFHHCSKFRYVRVCNEED